MNSKKNEYEAIMTKIRAGLTGDAGDDIRYLMETTEHYKDHPLGREISRECGRMIWELTPNEQKQQFTESFDKDLGVIGERLDEAERERNKKNVTGALALVEDAVRIIEDCGLFKDDEVSEYKSFGELFEDLLYNHRYDPKKEVRQISLPIVRAYMMLGSLLIDNGRPEDARKALAKGLKWDPVSFMLTVEYTETSASPAI